MANKISTILDLDDKGFKSALKGIGKSVGDADGMFGKFKAGAKGAFDGLKQFAAEGALAAGAALVAFSVKAVGAFTDVAKEAIDLSTATGLNIEEASRWVGVADDYVVSSEALATGLGKVAKTLDDTKWDKYGIATRDASGEARATNDILLDTFDMLSKVDNKTEQAVIGQELFGKGYQSLTPILGHTREEYEAMLGAVEKGQVITEKEAAKAEKMRLAQDKLADSIKEVTLAWGQVVAGMSPFIERVADGVTEVTGAVEKIDDLADSIGGLGTVLDIMKGNPVTVFQDLKDAAGEFTSYLDMSLPDAVKLIDDMGYSAEQATELIKKWHQANDGAAGSNDDVTTTIRTEEQAVEDLTGFIDKVITGIKDEKTAADDLKTGMDNLTSAIIDEYTAQHEATQAAIDAIGGTGDLEQSIRDVASSYYDLTTQIAENDKTQKDSKVSDGDKAQSQRDLESAIHDHAGEVYDLAKQYADESGAAEGSKEQHDLMRDALILNKAQYPLLADEIDKYIAKLDSIPGAVFTEVNLHSTGGVGRKVAIAEGGYVPARPGGTDAVIGEGGQGEFVIPLDKMPAMMNGGNGHAAPSIIVNVHGTVISERDLVKAIYNGIIDGQRRGELVAGIA